MPTEVGLALASHKDFSEVEAWKAEPEVRLPFDSFGGEPRNSDLIIQARDSNDRFLIAIEGKGHEPFGPTVADALAAAVERKLVNARSNGVARIEQLAADQKAAEGERNRLQDELSGVLSSFDPGNKSE